MKRLLAIGSLVSLASIGACGSGPDLTKNAPDVVLVKVSQDTGCSGTCGFISGFALGSSGAYSMFDVQGGTQTIEPQLATDDFASGSARLNGWTPGTTTGTGVSGTSDDYDIVVSSDHKLVWAGNPLPDNNGPTSTDQITVYSATEAALQTPNAIAPSVAMLPIISTGSGGSQGSTYLVGLAADPDAVYVEYAQDAAQPQGGIPTTPDSQSFPGSQSSNDAHDPAALARIDRNAPTTAPETVNGFFLSPNIAIHLLAQSTTELYFPDKGPANGADTALRVLAQPKGTFGTSTPAEIWRLANSQGTTVVGIAANDAYVAWVTSTFQPVGGHVGCNIYASAHDGPAILLSGSTNGPGDSTCSGIALDDTYAYVAITSEIQQPNNTGSGGGDFLVTVGTGIMRVPLAGGPAQTVSLQSQRWYGPRRVFVDDRYVYGIDPDFVARLPKTDFPQ